MKNILYEEDAELSASMENNYQSEKEKEFFEKQKYKQEYVMTSSNELVMSEYSNSDQIYIVRCWFEEYIVGCAVPKMHEEHYMTLAEALAANLKEINLLDRDITLLQWLRERDYEGVEYDHNFDDL